MVSMPDQSAFAPWLEFEKIAAEIQRQLAPNATVCHNERIVGKSGVERGPTLREHARISKEMRV
jgi:hypothetical protein